MLRAVVIDDIETIRNKNVAIIKASCPNISIIGQAESVESGISIIKQLSPDIVFLDEPTSGLDPIGAAEFDELVAKLRDTMGLTVYMVTHDLDSLFSVCDRIAVLGNKKVLVEGTVAQMLESEEPWVKSYFRGKRARQLDLTTRT